MGVLRQVQDDAAALKAGDRQRAGALRLIVSELQKAEKDASPGRVMSALMPRVAGRADGKRVSVAVRERLTDS